MKPWTKRFPSWKKLSLNLRQTWDLVLENLLLDGMHWKWWLILRSFTITTNNITSKTWAMRLVRLCLILLKQCKERGRSLWMGIPWHLQIKQLKQTKLSSKGNFSRIEEDCKPMETTPTGTGLMETGLMGTILIEMAQGITGTIIIPVVLMRIRCLSGLSNSKLIHTTITQVPM